MPREHNDIDKARRKVPNIPATRHPFEEQDDNCLNCGQSNSNTCTTTKATLADISDVAGASATNMCSASLPHPAPSPSDDLFSQVTRHTETRYAIGPVQGKRQAYLAAAHQQSIYGKISVQCCIVDHDTQELILLAFGEQGVSRRGQSSQKDPIGRSPRMRKAKRSPSGRWPIANGSDTVLKHNSAGKCPPTTSSRASRATEMSGQVRLNENSRPTDDTHNLPLVGHQTEKGTPDESQSRPAEDRHVKTAIRSASADTPFGVDEPLSQFQSHESVASHDEGDSNPVAESSMYDDLEWKIEAIRNVIAPVTKENIKELELTAIQNTLSLRIDLCFDHDLYFQRISGIKGEEKRVKARIFYRCLSIELKSIMHSLKGSTSECEHEDHTVQYLLPSRLGAFFSSLRDLLELLVPDTEKEEVLQRVDAGWLTNQVRVGLFDAVPFAIWLCELLMRHCAPMRDEMALKMRQKIVDGAEQNNMDTLVEGLEILLNLLENMKIDVANHQVRSFKLLLIADTVPFLKDCFKKMVNNHQLDLEDSKDWFKEIQDVHRLQSDHDFDRFIHGLVDLIRMDQELQTTFTYDKERIEVLRTDLLDLVQLEICEITYCKLAGQQPQKGSSRPGQQKLSDRILKLISSEDGTCDRIENHIDAIAIELARAVADIDVDIASPSSTSLPSDSTIKLATSLLKKNLDQEKEMHNDTMYYVVDEVVKRTIFHAKSFEKLDTLQISNSQRTWSMDRLAKGFLVAPDVEDISRRLAHIAIIHWQVWYGLVYSGSSRSLSRSPSESDLGFDFPSGDLFT